MVSQPRVESTQSIVEAIKKVGPRNCAEIARLTGIPARTVRYKLAKHLGKKGITVRVNINLAKLGLTQLWVSIKFSEDIEEVATRVLQALSNIGCLIYYAKIIPRNNYIALFAIPAGTTEKFRELFISLKDLGTVKSFELHELAWQLRPSMETEYYNFDLNKWVIDWNEIEKIPVSLAVPEVETPSNASVDEIDLALIAHLQVDATISIQDMAKKMQRNPKTLAYHLRKHIFRGNLVWGYNVNWFGPPTEPSRKWVLNIVAEVQNIAHEEVQHVRKVFKRIPFLYSEAYSLDGFYGVQIFCPADHYTDLVTYFGGALRNKSDELIVGIVDRREAKRYTIPYEMFRDGRWVFNVDEALALFRRLALELSSGRKEKEKK